VLLIESQLLARKQYLGTYGSPGRKRQSQELDALNDDGNKDQKQRLEEPCGPKHLHPRTRSGQRLGGDSLRQRRLEKCTSFHVRTDFLLGT